MKLPNWIKQIQYFLQVWSEEREARRRFASHHRSRMMPRGYGKWEMVCEDCGLNHNRWSSNYCNVYRLTEGPYLLQATDTLEENV